MAQGSSSAVRGARIGQCIQFAGQVSVGWLQLATIQQCSDVVRCVLHAVVSGSGGAVWGATPCSSSAVRDARIGQRTQLFGQARACGLLCAIISCGSSAVWRRGRVGKKKKEGYAKGVA